MRGNVTRKIGGILENTFDMRSVIELLTGRNKSDVKGARAGRPRTNITSITDIKTDWLGGARNVQIKLSTKHVRDD